MAPSCQSANTPPVSGAAATSGAVNGRFGDLIDMVVQCYAYTCRIGATNYWHGLCCLLCIANPGTTETTNANETKRLALVHPRADCGRRGKRPDSAVRVRRRAPAPGDRRRESAVRQPRNSFRPGRPRGGVRNATRAVPQALLAE